MRSLCVSVRGDAFVAQAVLVACGRRNPRLVLRVIDARPSRQTVFAIVRRRIEPVIGHDTAYRFGLFCFVRSRRNRLLRKPPIGLILVAPFSFSARGSFDVGSLPSFAFLFCLHVVLTRRHCNIVNEWLPRKILN